MSFWKGASGRQWALWFGVLAVATLGLFLLRGRLDKAHFALVFLLVVLGGSAAGGRLLGITLAGAAFLVFDVGFVPPYYTIQVTDPFDWIVLFVFLATGVIAAELLERQRKEAEVASARTSEIDRLATLGAETLNAPRPEDALKAIADVIRQSMHTDECDISLTDSRVTNVLSPDEKRDVPLLPTRFMRIPLRIRDTTVGTLTLRSKRPFLLSRDQERVLGALSYYAALGVERVRLASAESEAESLRRADRLKDALLASVSHDLRTPLTTIKGIANEIARGGDSGRAYVIEEEADRLTSLVDDLLDLSQLAAGEMDVNAEVNTADDVIGAALQRVESSYPDRSIETEAEGPWTELVGRFDFVHTMRVLTNLLDNASKYAPRGTPVRLKVWRELNELNFSVVDAGEAIPEEERERIFEPFFRGSLRRDEARGTGLGLSIARRLAQLQGGHLLYAPTSESASRFVFSVPAADVPAPDVMPQSL
jgi:two-component system sensor histidine kinase KdpD